MFYLHFFDKLPVQLNLCCHHILQDLPGAIRKIADFLGKKLTSNDVSKIATHCSLENMRNNNMLNISYQRSLRALDDSLGGFINKGELLFLSAYEPW